MEIISRKEYDKIIDDNEHHLAKLKELVDKSGEQMEGDCFYRHLSGIRDDSLVNKQINLFTLAKHGNSIGEIGFNAGSSALIFLISNPNAHVWCFDICEHSYTKPCFEYLREQFGDRINLIEGSSVDTVGVFLDNHPNTYFDVVHIDGSHDYRIANLDFFHMKDNSNKNAVFIWDDVYIPSLAQLWAGYVNKGLVKPFNLLPVETYQHALGFLPTAESKNIAVCSLTLGDEYKVLTKNGRETKVRYCKKHGYDFFDEEDIVDWERPPAWAKIKLVLKHLSNYDYVVWIDGDSFVMNAKYRLEDLIHELSENSDIMVAQDWTMLNTGVMFIKNTDWSKDFLKLVYEQTEFMNHPNWEQAAFIHLLENNTMNAKDHIKVLPLHLQNKINAYWYSYHYGDFILHFPGCWRDNKEYGLGRCMEKFCPIKKDNEDQETYERRIHWLKYESRAEADALLKSQQ